MTATILPFRKNCQWNDGGACLAKSPFACICRRPSMIKAARQLPKPSPHSPYHTSLLMQPGRDAGSIGATAEMHALEHAAMIAAISEHAKPTGDIVNDDDFDFNKAFPSADAKTTVLEIKNVYPDIVLPTADESGC